MCFAALYVSSLPILRRRSPEIKLIQVTCAMPGIIKDLGKVSLAQVVGYGACCVFWALTIAFPALQSMTAVTGSSRGRAGAAGLKEASISIAE